MSGIRQNKTVRGAPDGGFGTGVASIRVQLSENER